MNRNYSQVLQIIHAFLDLLLLNLSVLLAFYFLGGHILFLWDHTFYNFILPLNLSWLLFGILGDVYSVSNPASIEMHFGKLFSVYLSWFLVVSMYVLLFEPDYFSGTSAFFTLLLFGFFLVLNRFLFAGLRSLFKKKHYLSENVLIVGYNDTAKKLASYFETQNSNAAIVGFCEEYSKVNELSNYPILSSINNVFDVAGHYRINQIYSTISPEEDSRIKRLMQEADNACIRFNLIPDLTHFVNAPFHVSYESDMPVLFLHAEPLSKLINFVEKRIFDIVFSILFLLLIFSWVLPLIALLIKLTSKGPVFYIQNRLGKNNTVFRMYKFRTMTVMERDNEFIQVTKDDPRVTRFGQFLRVTSLDELPQFVNVLKGEMSVIGPRPHALRMNEQYKELIETYMSRHFLKPGITGWAQVNGCRGETRTTDDMKERVDKDLWYMENWSLWLDIKIIFKTVYNFFRKEEKAY